VSDIVSKVRSQLDEMSADRGGPACAILFTVDEWTEFSGNAAAESLVGEIPLFVVKARYGDQMVLNDVGLRAARQAGLQTIAEVALKPRLAQT
jgi:hypothetical protein